MPTALRNHQAIYSLKRGNYFPDILPTIFYWPHHAIAMLNRLMQLFVQFFSQCMNLQHKFSINSDRHTHWKPSQRSLRGIGKFQLLTPRMWKRAEKNDEMLLWSFMCDCYCQVISMRRRDFFFWGVSLTFYKFWKTRYLLTLQSHPEDAIEPSWIIRDRKLWEANALIM